MLFRSVSLIVTLFLVGQVPSRVEAKVDPSLKWHTLESKHFFMHYYDGEEALARDFLALSEEAYEFLVERFQFVPSQRTHLMLVDDVDSANGLTSVMPYDTILFYGYVPDVSGDLGFWGDWKRILVYHELTHAFHLDHATGLPGFGNLLFGKTFLPNAAVPDWFTEGLAVRIESIIGAGGRIDSPKFDMYLRVAVLEDEPLPIDVIGGSPLALPRGSVSYLYGSYFIEWIGRNFGFDGFFEFVREQGHKVNPHSLNISARRIFSRSFVVLYKEWVDALKERFRADAAERRKRGLIEGRRIHYAGESQPMVSFMPDGSLLWLENTGHETRHLRRMTPAGEQERLRNCLGGCDRPTATADGQIFYSSLRYYHQFYFFQELFQTDWEGDDRTRLTWGGRIKDPHPSPDGKRVAYVHTVLGFSTLTILDLETDQEVDLYTVEGGMSWPTWSPDGRQLAVAIQENGTNDIWVFPPSGGEPRNITAGPSFEMQPTWTPEGDRIVFVSTLDGVFNLYSVELKTGCVSRLTNVLGGAFDPAVSPDGKRLVYAGYHFDGFYLEELPFSPERCDDIDLSASASHRTVPPPRPIESQEIDALVPRPYCPLATVYPRSWTPSFLAGSFDTTVMSVETSGTDPVGQVSYTAGVTLNTQTWDSASTLSLNVNRWFPNISVFGGYYTSTLLARVGGRYHDYLERDVYVSSAVQFPFPHTEYSFSVTTGYVFDHFRGAVQGDWEYDPGGIEDYVPLEGNLATVYLITSFDNTETFPWSISVEKGTRVSAEVRGSAPVIGSNWSRWETKWRLTQYIPVPFLDHHVLMAHYRGGIAGGGGTFMRTFTVGGYPDQDIVSDLLENGGISGMYLRGYPQVAARGKQYHFATLEYRFPIWRIRRGVQTFPIFFKDLHMNLFGNGAGAFDAFDPDALMWGTGGELNLDFVLGYINAFTLTLGTAYGFQEPGGFGVYVLLGK